MKIFKWSILISLLLLIVGYGLICWNLSDRILVINNFNEHTKSGASAKWSTLHNDKLAKLPTPEDFEITTHDNITIKGKYFEKSDSSNCAVVLSHGYSTTWGNMLKYTPLFNDCSCNLVFYDHRGHGVSDGAYPTGGILESKDLYAVTDWVKNDKNIPFNRIGWLGCSWGAAACLQAGAENRDIAFIIADSPFQDWYSAVFERAILEYGSSIKLLAPSVFRMVNIKTGVNYKDASTLLAAKKIKEPVLLIHSKTDPETSSTQSVNISKQLQSSKSKFYETEWGNLHTQDVVNDPDKYKVLVDKFLSDIDWKCK